MGIKINSQKIKEGDLFFCLEQDEIRAKIYIQNAIKNGAKEVFTSIETDLEKCTKVENVKDCLKEEIFKNYSQKPTNIIAITGTNGKTSTAYFAFQILQKLGLKSIYIGTIGVFASDEKDQKLFDKFKDDGLTTPDVATLHEILNIAKTKAGCEFVIFEASSHGIFQERIDFLDISVAGFTNLTQDHLDLHKNMQNYFEAKLKLFTKFLNKNGSAVVNLDDEKGSEILEKSQCKNKISYGINGDLKLESVVQNEFLQTATINYLDKKYIFSTSLIGSFQIQNLLCAIGCLLSSGVEIEQILSTIKDIKAPSGRLEFVGKSKIGAGFFVDFAHTPDAMQKSLSELRKITKGKLICVFGCGGNRDKDKRGKMGVTSTSIANLTIITDDNPRNEDPIEIRKNIIDEIVATKRKKLDQLKNFPHKRVMLFALENEDFFGNFCEIADRKSAIEYAFENAKENDTVLIAGKGHESYQIIGDQKRHFSDQEEILKLINQD